MSHWPIKPDTMYACGVPRGIRIGHAAATLNFTVYYVTESHEYHARYRPYNVRILNDFDASPERGLGIE